MRGILLFKAYVKLTKLGIGLFVMITGLAGYAASLPLGQGLDLLEPVLLLMGLYFLSGGSFAINQAQEWRADAQMPRTASRPVPSGAISVWQAYLLGILFCVGGLGALLLLSPLAAGLGLLTVVLYNGIYTLYWKKKWAFGAVPGAIPGAMPVVIGYSANSQHIFSPDSVYLFLILFLWQMPHFWSLAVRYKDDYEKGGFPVLPARIGVERTLYHVGLYTFTYIGVALAAPWFVNTHVLYLLVVLPLAIKVLWEFFSYYSGKKTWLPFFLWVNLSMLAFICVPVFDRWFRYFIHVM
jgi:protoheme IX farnesyltransferase